MFPCARFKALDYVFEERNRLMVIMNLLSLPTPYISYKDDPYPHTGTLAEGTYRKPWVRGKAISTCTLSTSVLDDLRGTTQHVNSTEKFDNPGSIKIETTASCSANSAEILHQGEESKLAHLCEESFVKLTVRLDIGFKDQDLLLPEDMVAANFFHRFKHLPTLKSKVSRLKTLLVADPLISLSGNSVTEQTISRHCAPYETSSDVQHIAELTEEYTKESQAPNESLLLPELLNDCMMTVDYPRSFSSVCCGMNVVAEELDEKLPDMKALYNDDSASVDIFHFSSMESTVKSDWMKNNPPEWVMLPTEMELEVILTPPTAATSHYQARLSVCDLQREELSPLGVLSLASAEAEKQMGVALWKAEKYPNYVLKFLFGEPELEEAVVKFQPLSEALKLTTMESLVVEADVGEFLGNMRESPERLSNEVPSHEEDCIVPDFSKVPTEHDGEEIFQIVPAPPEESQTASVLVQKLTSSDECPERTLPLDTKEVKPLTSTDNGSSNKTFAQVSHVPSRKLDGNLRSQKTDDQRGVVRAARRRPLQHADPLTTFMMLRSHQVSTPTAAPEEEEEKERVSEVQPTPQQTRKADRKPATTPAIITAEVSGHASRGQVTTAAQDVSNSRVVQVQATDSQRQAYRELLSLARPRLSSAKELGLNLPAWRDFEHLASDQTRYVLKQREMALCRRTPAGRGGGARRNGDVVVRGVTRSTVDAMLSADEEQLFHQVFVIHVLVTARELLFKCHLSAAVEYLSKATETCTDTGVIQLLRRLHIISHLGLSNHESDVKLRELQKLVVARLHNDKILVIISLNCDDGMSTILQSLKQLTAASTVRPDNDKSKLNGATVVGSVVDSGCVLVLEQHLGPDFPWDLFSLVVEYDHPGPSPWATVCKERRVQHLTFNTVPPGGDEQESEDSLEDKVAYVLFVTESLLNCPLLLQMLESTFNITLLERSHCPSLQMLGGTNHYSVITVDESTAIIVQEQDELCEERACEVIAMRLTALSLQYNYCWIILHYPDGKGGGFSSEAFSNLVVLYSSLVLFGMKLEDLEVKVLIASEVSEVARWVNRICFLSLMSCGRDPAGYLERDWLAVVSSQEELSLLRFPCVNPLVAQLMLRRAPSLPWLLAASLTQLAEMLPEVPHKVLKLFSNATSLYEAQPAQVHPLPPPPPPPTEEAIPASDLFPSSNPSFLLTPDDTEISFYSQEETAYFTHDPTWPAGSPEVSDWSGARLWNAGNPEVSDWSAARLWNAGSPEVSDWSGARLWNAGSPEVSDWSGARLWNAGSPEVSDWSGARLWNAGSPEVSDWSGARLWNAGSGQEVASTAGEVRADVAGMPIGRRSDESPRQGLRALDGPFCRLSPPSRSPLWRGGPTGRGWRTGGRVSNNYGSRCRMGLERKRSEEAAGLTGSAPTPLKKSRLSYERVPGWTDGQTRLKLF
ncbi:protein shortage in chiasmata 1 ortholog [Vanacampus margaritifer]